MRRRTFLIGGLLVGCEATLETFPRFDSGTPHDAGLDAPMPDSSVPFDAGFVDARIPDAGFDGGTDAGFVDVGTDVPTFDACVDPQIVTLHDTYAQALYFDGTYGPTTGVIRVADMVAGVERTLEFWHGHGGLNHAFTILPTDFEALRRGERVTLITTEVDSHQHMLFIDPVDSRWRVEGAADETVEICS